MSKLFWLRHISLRFKLKTELISVAILKFSKILYQKTTTIRIWDSNLRLLRHQLFPLPIDQRNFLKILWDNGLWSLWKVQSKLLIWLTQDYIPSNNKHFYDGLFGFHPLAASDLTGEEQVVRRVVGRQAVVVVAAADVNLKTRWTGYWKKRKK